MKKRLLRFIKKGKLYEVLYVLGLCLILSLFIKLEITLFITVILLFFVIKFSPFLPAYVALAFIVSWPVLVALGKESWAEKTGFAVYYLLVIAVVLYLIKEYMLTRKRPVKKKSKLKK